jgi:transketolase
MSGPTYASVMGVDEATGQRPVVEAPFGNTLAALGRNDPRIVGLTADLGRYTDIHPFRDAFPERFLNVGMAEQNLVAVAAGMARTGLVPFATTYGVFATRRAYDFIAVACAHSNLDVKIVAGLPGLTTGYGATHQAIEDLALMRMVPNLTVIDPCDATDIEQATAAIAEHPGTVYMRLLRGQVRRVLDPATYRFTIGKAALLRPGSDVLIVATGLMTEQALDAASILERAAVDTAVLHVPTLEPFDAAAVAEVAARVGLVVTAENHVVRGGLASQVAEALFDARLDRPLLRIGLPNSFAAMGAVPTLMRQAGLTAECIARAIQRTAAPTGA